uniref:FecR family protein n=1 Tax=Pedobacter schmidteae TaxID=2201271 RepID=UPI000EAD2A47|nr:FecR domain-containing protein [Pedobacter schmidteae]
MSGDKLKQLIHNYEAGTCSAEEKAALENWYANVAKHNASLPLPQELWDEQEMRLQQILQSTNPIVKKRFRICRKLRIQIAAAAAILLIVGTAFYFFGSLHHLPAGVTTTPPSGNQVTLALGNNTFIALDPGKTGVKIQGPKLIYNDGEEVIENITTNKLQNISTPRGVKYQIVLADGTRVWLNALSSLTFSAASTKNGTNRRVKLAGEAYFEVAKTTAVADGKAVRQHFTVVTNRQQITVLGTHFNVSSYANEPVVKTTLLEGSVSISAPGLAKKNILLKPGQQFCNTGADGKVSEADTEAIMAWQQDLLVFRNEPLENIMKKVARWYDIDVVYDDPDVGKVLFGGALRKGNDVTSILAGLEDTGRVKFETAGHTIIVKNSKPISL